jgi:proteasome lid subunit RPN8/RPN11
MIITNLDLLYKHVLACYPQEACGIVLDNVFIPLENIADNPGDSFRISADYYEQYQDTMQAVIHSHTHIEHELDPRTPSLEDMKGADATDIPWGIVHCDGTNLSEILWFNTTEVPPLLNRPYIPNVYDCFTLVRDFYRQEYDIDLGLHPRPAKWDSWDISYIWKWMEIWKDIFIPLEEEDVPRYGDVVLFHIGSTYPTHLGICISDETMIHHLYNKYSCEDKIHRWKRQIGGIYRYKR